MAWDGPKWGAQGCFPTNPDLADVFGRTDLDFENYFFLGLCGPNISGFPGPQIFKFSDLEIIWDHLESYLFVAPIYHVDHLVSTQP